MPALSMPLQVSLRSNRLSFISPSTSLTSQTSTSTNNSTNPKTPLLQKAYRSLIVPKLKRRKKARVTDLPMEILIDILRNLDEYDVKRLLVVNRRFYRVAVSELYRAPVLRNTFKCAQLITLLASNRYGVYVNHLDLSNLDENEDSLNWRDWKLHKPTQTSGQFQKDIPTGHLIHFLNLCANLVSLDLSGLPLAPDYYIKFFIGVGGGDRFVSDVSNSRRQWGEEEVCECTAKHLFDRMANMVSLRRVALRDTTWVSRPLLLGLLQQNNTIEWMDLQNAGMVKHAAWAVAAHRLELLNLLE